MARKVVTTKFDNASEYLESLAFLAETTQLTGAVEVKEFPVNLQPVPVTL